MRGPLLSPAEEASRHPVCRFLPDMPCARRDANIPSFSRKDGRKSKGFRDKLTIFAQYT